MDELKLLLKNIANLFKLKTIVTLLLISAMTVGFLQGMVSVDVYAPMVMAVITYYFTRKDGE